MSSQSPAPHRSERRPQQKVGIGVVLTEEEHEQNEDDARIVVLDLIPGASAHLDGSIQIGTQILAVDGVGLRGLSLDDIRGMISGPPNTKVCGFGHVCSVFTARIRLILIVVIQVRIAYAPTGGYPREVTLARAGAPDSGRRNLSPRKDSPQRRLQPSSDHESPKVAALRQVLTHRQASGSKRDTGTLVMF
jgi:hypothetical protein